MYAAVGENGNSANAQSLNTRLGKILRFGGSKATVGVDIYNLFNAAPALSYNQAFIPNGAWFGPTSMITGW